MDEAEFGVDDISENEYNKLTKSFYAQKNITPDIIIGHL